MIDYKCKFHKLKYLLYLTPYIKIMKSSSAALYSDLQETYRALNNIIVYIIMMRTRNPKSWNFPSCIYLYINIYMSQYLEELEKFAINSFLRINISFKWINSISRNITLMSINKESYIAKLLKIGEYYWNNHYYWLIYAVEVNMKVSYFLFLFQNIIQVH